MMVISLAEADGFLRSRHGTSGMPEKDWLGSSSILSGALKKGCKRMMS
jgi:hypothetical protein